MTDEPKKRFRSGLEGADLNLDSLLGSLGQALNAAGVLLEQGQAAGSETTQSFETPLGPVKAATRVRVRLGGMAAGKTPATAKPINPGRAPTVAPRTPDTTDIAYEIFEDDESWILVADMPGVAIEQVSLSKDGTSVVLKTQGPRAYRAQFAPPCSCPIDRIKVEMTNGILTLTFPKDAAK